MNPDELIQALEEADPDQRDQIADLLSDSGVDMTRRQVMAGGVGLAGLLGFSGTAAAATREDWDCTWTSNINADLYKLINFGGFTGDGLTGGKTLTNIAGTGLAIDDNGNLVMTLPTSQLDELQTQEATSFFNHTFARPESPDTKNWRFDPADVTKLDSEVEVASTGTLVTTQRGNYPPGSEATPGGAFRLTGTPTAGEAFMGYATDANGLVCGEDTTDSFIEIRKGGLTKRVYRADWNNYVPDSRVWVDNRPVITRMPHLFYGGGDLRVNALLHGDTGSKLRTLHTFTADNVNDAFGEGPPIDQPNLPVRFESSSLAGGRIRGNACHYQFQLDDNENRINGETFSGVSVASTGWTPLIAWRKRTGWDMVNAKPLKINTASETNDVKVALQLDPTVSGGTWTLPENTSSSETAIEVNTGVTLDAVGERRWVGYSHAGQGNATGQTVAGNLTFNLPAGQTVVLAAQGIGGTATVSGVVAWEEFF